MTDRTPEKYFWLEASLIAASVLAFMLLVSVGAVPLLRLVGLVPDYTTIDEPYPVETSFNLRDLVGFVIVPLAVVLLARLRKR